jgi:hypothetical protein
MAYDLCMKTSTLSTNRVHPALARSALLLVSLLIACFGLLAKAQAVSPPPDGGYANGNTAEGTNALFNLTTGAKNTADGYLAMFFNTSGQFNTAMGSQALYSNTTGSNNTALGIDALFHNITGINNTAAGYLALLHNREGSANTSVGFEALMNNTNGSANTAVGSGALSENTTGFENAACGNGALLSNTIGADNTAVGYQALYNNVDGEGNTATGHGALISNTSGSNNEAVGEFALPSNTTGAANTAIGNGALFYSRAGNANIAIGFDALFNSTGDSNTAIGNGALYENTGMANIALGFLAGTNLTTGNFNIDIGNQGVAAEANTIRIGTVGTQNATFVAGISGATVTGTAVVVNGSGQLGVAPSSKRFKDEIKPMDKASEALLSLRPVTFRYKKNIDAKGAPQFGLVAEEVEKINSDLIVRDKEGKPYTVRYDAVNAMLLNEFLKEHRKVVEQQAITAQVKSNAAKQEATIAELTAGMDALTATVKEQAAQIQKVSAQLEASKPAPQVVANNH